MNMRLAITITNRTSGLVFDPDHTVPELVVARQSLRRCSITDMIAVHLQLTTPTAVVMPIPSMVVPRAEIKTRLGQLFKRHWALASIRHLKQKLAGQ